GARGADRADRQGRLYSRQFDRQGSFVGPDRLSLPQTAGDRQYRPLGFDPRRPADPGRIGPVVLHGSGAVPIASLYNDEAVASNAVPMIAQTGLAGDVHLPGAEFQAGPLAPERPVRAGPARPLTLTPP